MANYERFRVQLEKDKARLGEMIERRRASAATHASSSVNDSFSNSGDDEFADAATDMFTQELDMTMLNKYKSRLAQVEVALVRMHEGTYGTCQRCNDALG